MIEKLEEFDLRAAATRALRDPTLRRREPITNHGELAGADWILETAQKHAAEKWPHHLQTQQSFLQELRETLALTVEREIELPVPNRGLTAPTRSPWRASLGGPERYR